MSDHLNLIDKTFSPIRWDGGLDAGLELLDVSTVPDEPTDLDPVLHQELRQSTSGEAGDSSD